MLNQVSHGMSASRTLPNGEVTTAAMRVSFAPCGPTVSKVANCGELRYIMSKPCTETYVKE